MRTVVMACGACGLLAGLLTACSDGGDVEIDELDGRQVAAMAERELQAENEGIPSGTMTCPDLAFDVGASVRCVRTAELGDGHVARVGGTVEVTSLESGGMLHVALDPKAAEFGVTGEWLAADVRRRFAARFGQAPLRVSCPYLRGVVGTRVACRFEGESPGREADVVVTAVDADEYRTAYTVRLRRVAR